MALNTSRLMGATVAVATHTRVRPSALLTAVRSAAAVAAVNEAAHVVRVRIVLLAEHMANNGKFLPMSFLS
jgi:hypothetical protein